MSAQREEAAFFAAPHDIHARNIDMVILRARPFELVSSTSTATALERLDRYSLWRTVDGLAGRRRGSRLSLFLPYGVHRLLIPALVAKLDASGPHLEVAGRLRPVRAALAPLVIPPATGLLLLWVPMDNFLPVLGLLCFTTILFGWLWRSELAEYEEDSAALLRELQRVIAGHPDGGAKKR